MRDTERKRQRHRLRKKQALCREPDVGIDSRILGSHPQPKADAQPLSHPGVPRYNLILSTHMYAQTCHFVVLKIILSPSHHQPANF